jgi:hypothetical protein
MCSATSVTRRLAASHDREHSDPDHRVASRCPVVLQILGDRRDEYACGSFVIHGPPSATIYCVKVYFAFTS